MHLSRTEEIITILQEECAEVIQACSKIRRFGWTSVHPDTCLTNSTNLEIEIGDMLAMVDLLVDSGAVNKHNLEIAIEQKKERLKKWSNLVRA